MYQIIVLIAKCLLASQWIKSNSNKHVQLNNKTLSDNLTHPNTTLHNKIQKEGINSYNGMIYNLNCSKFNFESKLNFTNHQERPSRTLDDTKDKVISSLESKLNTKNHQERPLLTLDDTKDGVFWSLYPKDGDIQAKTKNILGNPLVRRSRYPSSIKYFVVFPTRLEDGQFSLSSGTLVSLKWVLTAAHCLKSTKLPGKVYAGADFNVISEVPAFLPVGVQEGRMTAFYQHPNYDAIDPNNDRDLALIAVQGFSITGYVEPVKLSLEPWRPSGYSDCRLTAFGQYDKNSDKPKDYVKKTHQLVVSRPCKCLYAIMKRTGRVAAERLICTEPKRDFSLCPGGSGGGLVCDGELRGVDSYAVVYSNVQGCEIEYFYNQFSGASCGFNATSNAFQGIYPSLNWLNGHLKLFKVEQKSKKSSSSSMRYNFRLELFFALIGILLYYRVN